MYIGSQTRQGMVSLIPIEKCLYQIDPESEREKGEERKARTKEKWTNGGWCKLESPHVSLTVNRLG
jgi:hypothetical protein